VTRASPVFNLVFCLFYDMVFTKVSGASRFLIPFADFTIEAVLNQKVSEAEFLVSAAAVAYLETLIVRALFSHVEAANEWLARTGYNKKRENFHRSNPRFREQMCAILKLWYDKFLAKKSRNRLSVSGLMGGNEEEFSESEYPDAAADEERMSRLHLFNAGEASAAAAVHSSRLTLRLTCR
jgi:hypothetical protein